jgi:hypothetical protein
LITARSTQKARLPAVPSFLCRRKRILRSQASRRYRRSPLRSVAFHRFRFQFASTTARRAMTGKIGL